MTSPGENALRKEALVHPDIWGSVGRELRAQHITLRLVSLVWEASRSRCSGEGVWYLLESGHVR